jgi:hypothetical protein
MLATRRPERRASSLNRKGSGDDAEGGGGQWVHLVDGENW